jgi:hypothetical protein
MLLPYTSRPADRHSHRTPLCSAAAAAAEGPSKVAKAVNVADIKKAIQVLRSESKQKHKRKEHKQHKKKRSKHHKHGIKHGKHHRSKHKQKQRR